jgi:hypothetical protein
VSQLVSGYPKTIRYMVSIGQWLSETTDSESTFSDTDSRVVILHVHQLAEDIIFF